MRLAQVDGVLTLLVMTVTNGYAIAMPQVVGLKLQVRPQSPKGDRDPQGECSQPEYQSSMKGDGGGSTSSRRVSCNDMEV